MVTWTVEEGYEVVKVIVDGAEHFDLLTAGSLTLTSVNKDHSVQVILQKIPAKEPPVQEEEEDPKDDEQDPPKQDEDNNKDNDKDNDKDKDDEPVQTIDNNNEGPINTSDNSDMMIWVLLMMLSMSMIVVLTVIKQRKHR